MFYVWLLALACIRYGLPAPRPMLCHEAETQRRLARIFQRYQDGLLPLEQAQRLAHHIRTETQTL